MAKSQLPITVPTDRELQADLAQLFRGPAESAPAPTLSVAGYIRRSRLEKYSEEESLSGQASRIARFAQERGLADPRIFVDAGYSGRRANRPGLHALQRAIKKGQVQVLVIDRLDRLSRDLIVLLQLVKLLNDHGVTLLSVREAVDFTQPFGRLVLYVLGALAEFYSRMLSEEIRLVRRHEAEQGKLSSTYRFGYCNGRCANCTDLNGPGYCPYAGGPDRHEGAFRIPHPIESVAVRLAYQWYATGHYSDDDIARRLNQELCVLEDGTEVAFRTKGKIGEYLKSAEEKQAAVIWQGEEPPPETPAGELRYPPGPFDRDAVRAILTNPLYAGFVAYYSTYENGHRDGQPLAGKKRRQPVHLQPGSHQLVPLSLYRQVQTLRRNRYHRTTGQQHPARTYPLTGLLFCAAAHSPLRGSSSNQGRQRYYVDTQCNQRLPSEQRHQAALPAAVLEQQVADLVTALTLPPAWRDRILTYVCYTEGQDELEREKFILREELRTAQELYRCGDYDRGRYEQVKQACQRRLAELAPTNQPAGQEAAQLLDHLPALWATLTDEELKTLYQHIFGAIYVNDDGLVSVEPRRAFRPLLAGCRLVQS